MKEQYGAKKPGSMWLRMIAGGGGGGLTFEQPENNIVRGAYYALISALSGAQTMALCCYDEAYTIPTRVRAAHLAAHHAAADRGDGPGRHGRPARRLVLRRDADQPDAQRDAGASWPRSTRQGGIVKLVAEGVDPGAGLGAGLPHAARRSSRARSARSASTATAATTRRSTRWSSTPTSEEDAARAGRPRSPRCARERDAARVRARARARRRPMRARVPT